MWDSEGAQNRTAIRNIYNNANSSGLWNFDYYIQDLAIPYLICNAEFKSGDYSFKWYKGGTDGQINFYMLVPFNPSETVTISFETSFSGAGYSMIVAMKNTQINSILSIKIPSVTIGLELIK